MGNLFQKHQMGKKILFIEEHLENPTGGIKSIKTLYDHLSKEHNTKFLWIGENRDKESLSLLSSRYSSNIPLEVKRTGYFIEPIIRNIKREIEHFDPDFIITQKQFSYTAGKYSPENTQTILFLRAYELLYSSQYIHRGNRKISRIANSTLTPINRRMAKKSLENTDITIANSKFVAEKYKEFSNISPKIIYPFIEPSEVRTEEKGSKILHVNPSNRKGIDTTLKIAENLPNQEFIVVGNAENQKIKERLKNQENIDYRGYVQDMRDIYAETKIALVPSRWEEPFGRIPVEAGINGIPTIVSNKGGLPESVGKEECVVQENTHKEYLKKIEEINKNYEKYFKQAKEAAEKRTAHKQLRKFDKLLQKE